MYIHIPKIYFDILHIEKNCRALSKFASLDSSNDFSREIITKVNVIQNELANNYWPKINNLLHINNSNPRNELKHLDQIPNQWRQLDELKLNMNRIKISSNDTDFFIATWSVLDYILAVIIILAVILFIKICRSFFTNFLKRKLGSIFQTKHSDPDYSQELDEMVPSGQSGLE